MKNNLELSISRSNFDPYFQMHATGQTRRTQSTTDTTAVVHFLWHRWPGMLKMSVSYTQLCQTSLQMDILTDLRQMFEINRRLKCEKNNPSPQYCNDYCSKSWYALCVNISRRPTYMYTVPYALFCNSRTAVLLIDTSIYYVCCE